MTTPTYVVLPLVDLYCRGVLACDATLCAAHRFVSRLPDTAHKAEEYAALGYQREAAEVAAKLRDGDLFGRIQAAVSANSPAGLAIAQLKDRFQSSFR